jgi:FMN hydrolase / 5-amino-6-(5-phospho-D-ribitylamino)uracil phosphatase
MHNPPRALSLDLDNTLWDTPPVLVQAESTLRSWLAEHEPSVASAFDSATFAALRQRIAAAHPEHAIDMTWLRTRALHEAAVVCGLTDPADFAQRAFEVFIAARNRIDPFEEVHGALGRLSRHVPIYALTNGNACVHRVGIGQHFSGSLDPTSTGAAKPDPRIYQALVAMAGVAPHAIWHVGDDVAADVLGARDAGLVPVWMNRDGRPWPVDAPPPEFEVRDLDELAELVLERLG